MQLIPGKQFFGVSSNASEEIETVSEEKKRNAFVKRKKYKEFNRRQQKEMIYECPRMIMD